MAPERADVVVVGGGILGCSAAYHLLEAGAGDVVLLERDDLAQGTSAAGAGFLGLWAAGYASDVWDDEELELERYALEFYGALAAEADIGWKRNGNLWVATAEQGWNRYLEPLAVDERVPDRIVLDPAGVEEATGVVRGSGVVGGVLHPGGAQVSAQQSVRALAARVLRRGGRIEMRRPVTGLRTSSDRIVGVETDRGPIATGTVVIAAGAWTNGLLAELGAFLPMAPLAAARIVTEPLGVPPRMPTLMVPEASFAWLREERGGLLLGCSFESRPRYDFVETGPPERFDQLPIDGILETQRCAARLANLIPVLAGRGTVTAAQGAPCYTPDLRALVGAVPGVEGLYAVTGCNEAGLTHGPGYGRLLAELITAGRSERAGPFAVGRFGASYASAGEVVQGIARGGRASWVDVTTTDEE